MNLFLKALPLLAATALFATGCQTQTEPATSDAATGITEGGTTEEPVTDIEPEPVDSDETEVSQALAQLSPEDREAAEAQKFCAVMGTSLLGSMGAPLKLDVKGQPVFLCCAGCKSKALRNPDATLETVARLKAANSSNE